MDRFIGRGEWLDSLFRKLERENLEEMGGWI